jgi:hypothetical protein
VTEIDKANIDQGNYSHDEKIVVIFTSQFQLNDSATEALNKHDHSKLKKVVLYPVPVHTPNIPTSVAISRQQIMQELATTLGPTMGSSEPPS